MSPAAVSVTASSICGTPTVRLLDTRSNCGLSHHGRHVPAAAEHGLARQADLTQCVCKGPVPHGPSVTTRLQGNRLSHLLRLRFPLVLLKPFQSGEQVQMLAARQLPAEQVKLRTGGGWSMKRYHIRNTTPALKDSAFKHPCIERGRASPEGTARCASWRHQGHSDAVSSLHTQLPPLLSPWPLLRSSASRGSAAVVSSVPDKPPDFITPPHSQRGEPETDPSPRNSLVRQLIASSFPQLVYQTANVVRLSETRRLLHSPVRQLIALVFPAPLGPRRHRHESPFMQSHMSLTATNLPFFGALNSFLRPKICTAPSPSLLPSPDSTLAHCSRAIDLSACRPSGA